MPLNSNHMQLALQSHAAVVIVTDAADYANSLGRCGCCSNRRLTMLLIPPCDRCMPSAYVTCFMSWFCYVFCMLLLLTEIFCFYSIFECYVVLFQHKHSLFLIPFSFISKHAICSTIAAILIWCSSRNDRLDACL
jgi:hypothetical protein